MRGNLASPAGVPPDRRHVLRGPVQSRSKTMERLRGDLNPLRARNDIGSALGGHRKHEAGQGLSAELGSRPQDPLLLLADAHVDPALPLGIDMAH